MARSSADLSSRKGHCLTPTIFQKRKEREQQGGRCIRCDRLAGSRPRCRHNHLRYCRCRSTTIVDIAVETATGGQARDARSEPEIFIYVYINMVCVCTQSDNQKSNSKEKACKDTRDTRGRRRLRIFLPLALYECPGPS